ncbi:MAG: rhodanese-related sulfurtransferase [Burkholderiales bacterium]|nr:rhodanese-related sulfurtransferase [Burkholderiales bacterium]
MTENKKIYPKLSEKSQKKKLYNRMDLDTARESLDNESFKRVTVSFYNYFKIEDPISFRDELFMKFNELGVLGRVYIAHEGINSQISVPKHNFAAFRDFLYSFTGLSGIRLNVAVDDDGKSFLILKIKVRDKIVADGIEDETFDVNNRGDYLNAEAFNKFMDENPDTLLLDMRNHYEYEVGHFNNASEVPSDTFREQLPMAVDMAKGHENKPIVMYCTGGIRCEKASAWMKHNGFNEVYHVEGGIIKYANEVKEKGLENKFIGKNFVFDDRLGERISDDIIANCHQCGTSFDSHKNCANSACHLLFIQCQECEDKYESCCSIECQEIIHLSEEEQAKIRKEKPKSSKIFNRFKDTLKK